MSESLPPMDEPKEGLSTGAKIAIGCAVVAVVIVATCGGLAYFGYSWAMGKVDEVAKKYEDDGYKRVTGQVIELRDPVSEPTVYWPAFENLIHVL